MYLAFSILPEIKGVFQMHNGFSYFQVSTNVLFHAKNIGIFLKELLVICWMAFVPFLFFSWHGVQVRKTPPTPTNQCSVTKLNISIAVNAPVTLSSWRTQD